jgi:glycerol-3-phosphate acyltransferase PlsX
MSKIGYLLVKPSLKAFRKKVDYAEYGGAPLLGIQGTVMICHGSSSPRAIMNAIKMAYDYDKRQVKKRMIERLDEFHREIKDDADPAEVVS